MVIFTAMLLAMIMICYVSGAAFLTIRDTPTQADAVVLFIGPDYMERRSEAHQLIKNGYSSILLIPALDSMWINRDGKWDNVVSSHLPNQGRCCCNPRPYPWYYENTHIEVLTALNMMAEAGWSSAVFVSSPIHMRRIRIITRYIVPNTTRYQIMFRGTRYVSSDNYLSLLHPVKARQVVLEYVKIAWFYLYHVIAKK
jgi:hypothetical protein